MRCAESESESQVFANERVESSMYLKRFLEMKRMKRSHKGHILTTLSCSQVSTEGEFLVAS